MQASAHVSFSGQCEEAFQYYEKHLGGKIERMMTHEGTPMADQTPPEWHKKIIHARIRLGDTVLMGADAPPARYQKPQGFSVTLEVETPAEAERIFGALSDNGTVQMAIQQTFFAVKFGMAFDRFGIPWIVICEKVA
jgi:PhnB protein